MKLKDGFITHNIDGCQVMVDIRKDGFNGIVRSNSTAAYIVDQLAQGVTREELLDRMRERYEDVSEETMSKDLDHILEQLRGIHALEE